MALPKTVQDRVVRKIQAKLEATPDAVKDIQEFYTAAQTMWYNYAGTRDTEALDRHVLRTTTDFINWKHGMVCTVAMVDQLISVWGV